MKNNTSKPKLLLAACCGPCATVALKQFANTYDIIVHFWGGNFDSESEYFKRLEALEAVNSSLNNSLQIIKEPYNPTSFLTIAKGNENAPEGGDRCKICYKVRLLTSVKKALELGVENLATTLTLSPHKNAAAINTIGKELGKEFGVNYIETDFKQNGGFTESIAISKHLGIYRQNYCGCLYSKKKT